jgi:hypothetical protein
VELPCAIYSEEDLCKLRPERREALEAHLEALWLYDPEIKDMLKNGNTLNAVGARLKEKTAGFFR